MASAALSAERGRRTENVFHMLLRQFFRARFFNEFFKDLRGKLFRIFQECFYWENYLSVSNVGKFNKREIRETHLLSIFSKLFEKYGYKYEVWRAAQTFFSEFFSEFPDV